MADRLKAKRRTGEFLVAGVFNREQNVKSELADPTISMDSGTPVAKRAADGKIVPWDKAAAAGSGTEVFYGFLYSPTIAQTYPSNTFVPVSVVVKNESVNLDHGRVPLLGSITRADVVAAAEAKDFTIYPGA